jgi:hypothetical protein
MARNSHQIIWMPAYKVDDDRIIDHYQRALGKKCDRRRAANIFKQDRDHYWRDMEGSRIQYCKLTDSWRGRKVGIPGPKFGVVRDSSPKLLRNILRANIGVRYWSGDEIRALFAKLFGPDKVTSKFSQARTKEIIKFSDPVWHLSTTPPPGALYVHQEASADQTAPIDPAEPKADTSEKPEPKKSSKVTEAQKAAIRAIPPTNSDREFFRKIADILEVKYDSDECIALCDREHIDELYIIEDRRLDGKWSHTFFYGIDHKPVDSSSRADEN